MKKVSEIDKILFTCAVAYGSFFGFLGSTLTFLSWIIAPFFGIALYHIYYRHIYYGVDSTIQKSFYYGILLGLILGGLPIWISVMSITPLSLTVKFILIFSTPLIVLISTMLSSLYYKFKKIHTNTPTPPSNQIA